MTGTPGGGTGGSGGSGLPSDQDKPSVTYAMARLTNVQYLNTAHDLFPSVSFGDPTLPNENQVGGFSNVASGQTATSLLVEDYEAAASQIADAVHAQFGSVVTCQPATAADETACATAFIADFGKRAYRRPLTADEGGRMLAFFQDQRTSDDFPTALSAVIEVFLQSPSFLYRLEGANPAVAAGAAPLTSYEMAARLSYLLAGSMPDAMLTAAADADQLTTPDAVEVQARRLLADPRAHQAVARFNYEWLKFSRMEDPPKDMVAFPDFSPTVSHALRDSTEAFVERAFWNDHALQTLLSDPHGFVNDDIASYFGVAAPGSSDMQLVDLDSTQRGGVLTQPGLLAALAGPVDDSPVQRGVLVLDSLLCNRPPPPPNGVNTMPPVADPTTPMTTRQRFETQHQQGSCAACHIAINGIGFAFENFDAVGKWRTEEYGQPVNSSTMLNDTDVDGDVNGAVDLVLRLAKSQQVVGCVSYQWMRYALGLDATQINLAAARAVAGDFAAGAGPMSELLVGIVKSDAFRSFTVATP
ncbi:MAG TPA: DUF1592 domain-containing protein [Polyangia bacterium]